MIILGIETSCDETAASVIEGHGGALRVLSNVVSSQIEIHKKYNGVVPEIAAREHVLNILPVINEALEKAGIPKTTPNPSLKRRGRKLDAIAVTIGPGLITSLIIGIESAKTLAYAWNLPIIGLNHIEGHVYGNFIEKIPSIKRGGRRPGCVFAKNQFQIFLHFPANQALPSIPAQLLVQQNFNFSARFFFCRHQSCRNNFGIIQD